MRLATRYQIEYIVHSPSWHKILSAFVAPFNLIGNMKLIYVVTAVKLIAISVALIKLPHS